MNATIPVTTGPLGVNGSNTSVYTGISVSSGITTVGTVSGSPWNYSFAGGGHAITVEGDARFEKDIIIKGVSLTDRLDAIETRLGILRPNVALEDKWEKLKALGEEYRKVEKEIIEGEQIWNTLSK